MSEVDCSVQGDNRRLTFAVFIGFLGLCLAAFMIGLLFMLYIGITSLSVNSPAAGYLGTLGDFIGGLLNPIVGLASIGLLAVTLMQNQRALKISADELVETRKELKRQAKASEGLLSIESDRDLLNSCFKDIEFYRLEIEKIKGSYKKYYLAGLLGEPTVIARNSEPDEYSEVYLVHSKATKTRNDFYRCFLSLTTYIELMLDTVENLPPQQASGIAEVLSLERILTDIHEDVRLLLINVPNSDGTISEHTFDEWCEKQLEGDKGRPNYRVHEQCVRFRRGLKRARKVKAKLTAEYKSHGATSRSFRRQMLKSNIFALAESNPERLQ